MKKNSLLFLFILCFLKSDAQKFYSAEYASQADIKVFVSDYEGRADLSVFKVGYSSQVGENNGKWFFVDYASQAGWRNQEKMHFIYLKHLDFHLN